MANDNTEAAGYDLNSTGTLAELPVTGDNVSWRLTADATADYVVEIRGNDVGWTLTESYSATDDIDDGKQMPEALRVRIRNTTTAAGTADLLLGVDN